MALPGYEEDTDEEDVPPPVGALSVARPVSNGLTSMYDTAIERLRSSRSGESSRAEKLLAISAAFGAPSRTGTFGERMGTVSKVLGETTAASREARQAREDRIAALEFKKAEAEQASQDRKEELQLRYGTPKPTRLVANPVTGAMQDPYTGKVVVPGSDVREETRRGVIGQVVKGEFKPYAEYAQPGKSLKTVPRAIAQGYLDNQNSAKKLDAAIRALDAYPEAVGLSRMAGDAVNQRIDPKGVDARAAIADVGSLLIHDRSGAAVTISETPRLLPFVPMVTDSPAAAKKKLNRLLGLVNEANAGIEIAYDTGEGYQPIPGTTPEKPKGRDEEIRALEAQREKRKGRTAPVTPATKPTTRQSAAPTLKPVPDNIRQAAKAAIAAGRDRAGVIKKLRDNGYDPGNL